MRRRAGVRLTPWRGERMILKYEGRWCRVCLAPLEKGTTVLYHPYAIGGTESHVECGFRTEGECQIARAKYMGPPKSK